MALSTLWARFRMRLWVAFINAILGITLRNPLRNHLVPLSVPLTPARTERVPSTHDAGRRIPVNVHLPPDGVPAASPRVLISLHGSGFTLNTFRMETELCVYLARRTGCVVLDVNYAKAPGYPFPAAYYDVLDVIAWARATWPGARIVLYGASSGGCLALSASAASAKDVVVGVVAMYPATDFSLIIRDEDVPKMAPGAPGHALARSMRAKFTLAYVPDGADRTDPRMSPFFAAPEAFPPVTVICGDCDPLYAGCVKFVKKMREAGADVEELVVPGVGHGWDKLIKPGTKYVQIRQDALDLIVRRMEAAWGK